MKIAIKILVSFIILVLLVLTVTSGKKAVPVATDGLGVLANLGSLTVEYEIDLGDTVTFEYAIEIIVSPAGGIPYTLTLDPGCEVAVKYANPDAPVPEIVDPADDIEAPMEILADPYSPTPESLEVILEINVSLSDGNPYTVTFAPGSEVEIVIDSGSLSIRPWAVK